MGDWNERVGWGLRKGHKYTNCLLTYLRAQREIMQQVRSELFSLQSSSTSLELLQKAQCRGNLGRKASAGQQHSSDLLQLWARGSQSVVRVATLLYFHLVH